MFELQHAGHGIALLCAALSIALNRIWLRYVCSCADPSHAGPGRNARHQRQLRAARHQHLEAVPCAAPDGR